MPTRAYPHSSSHTQRYRTAGTEEHPRNWTDDLPSCKLSGIGFSPNQIYRDDGTRRDEYEYEDCSFHFTLDEGTSLYSVFDGHGGTAAAHYAAQKLPAELLLGEVAGKQSDDEIKELLQQAFLATEKGYMESLGDWLAKRATLESELPKGVTPFEAYQQTPVTVEKLAEINTRISSGTTSVLALIVRDKLYVASVGNSRALLCRVDENGACQVMQITSDHDTHNEDELQRLQQLGLDVTKFRQGSRLGAEDLTRCIGNYHIKGGYKEYEELKVAIEEPVTAVPEVFGAIHMDSSYKFLLLLSGGLYRALEEATGTEQVNNEIAKLTMEQFRSQNTLTGVAQGVVDKVGRIHHDIYMEGKVKGCQKRGDMTLLVRTLGQGLPGSGSAETTSDTTTYTSSTETESSEQPKTNDENCPQLDENGRIAPYVDFSPYYEAMRKKT